MFLLMKFSNVKILKKRSEPSPGLIKYKLISDSMICTYTAYALVIIYKKSIDYNNYDFTTYYFIYNNSIGDYRLISEKNLAVLHLIAEYLLKNNFENQNLEDDYLTTHRCINITEDKINILFEEGQKHICKCPFYRLFMTN